MTIRLAKLHATGNDFLVLVADDAAGPADLGAADAARLCDRHRGIGADGLIALAPGGDGVDCTMLLRNADGGVAEMSGNGIRTLAWVARRHGYGSRDRLTVATGAGVRTLDLHTDPATGAVDAATCDMGPVTFDPSAIPLDAPSAFDLEATFHGVTYRGDAAGMGNPHLVVLVDDPDTTRVAQHGPRLEADPRFPQRANIEFVAVDARDRLRLRVWERGVGETLSCGTGVCASAAVAHRRGLVDDRVEVHVPGGVLTVELGPTIRLGGPVVHLFDVEVDLDRLRATA